MSGLPRTTVIIGAALCCCLSACADPAGPQFIKLTEAGARFGVFVVLNRAGVVTRHIDPVLAPRGETIGSMPRNIQLEKDELEIVFIGLSEDDLDARVPLLDDTRANEVSLRFGAWECEDKDLDHESRTVHIPIPDTAELSRWREGDSAFSEAPRGQLGFVANTALGFPIDFARCRADLPTELRAFGETAEQIPSDGTVLGVPIARTPGSTFLLAVTRVDDRRVLALSQYALFLFDKDRAYSDVLTHVLSFPAADGPLKSIAIDRRPGLGSIPVYVGAGSEGAPSSIHEALLTPDGLQFVRTETGGEDVVNEIVVDSDGRVIAVDEAGYVLTKSPNTTGLDVFPVARRLRAITLSPDPSRPHVLAGTDTIYIGDGFAHDFELHSFNALGIGTTEFWAVGALGTGSQIELWASGKSGVIGRTLDGPIERVLPDYSPQWLVCTSGSTACGESIISHTISELEIEERGDGDWIYMRADICDSALMAMNVQTLCVAELHLPPGDQSAGAEIIALEIYDGWLTAVGTGGRVFEMRL